jgi:hypothetical protein
MSKLRVGLVLDADVVPRSALDELSAYYGFAPRHEPARD